VISLYTEHVRAIGIEHLKRMLESGEPFTLLDVRSRSDYDKEHIKDALAAAGRDRKQSRVHVEAG
jgi:rhodanese-related sulfurtransferase